MTSELEPQPRTAMRLSGTGAWIASKLKLQACIRPRTARFPILSVKSSQCHPRPKSYGDLHEQYLTASYRVAMTEAQAKPVFAYIKHLQATTPLWNATFYNCISFIQDIARNMGLKVPGRHVLYPDQWVNQLRQLNGGRENQVVALSNILAGSAPKSAAPKSAAPKSAAPKTTEMPKNQSASATNIITRLGPDRLGWESRDRTLGGEGVPGIDEFTVVRKPPAPGR